MLLLKLLLALLSLLLHLSHMHIMVGLGLVFGVRLLARDLVNSSLEFLRILFHVSLVLVALLLQELILSLPQGCLLVILIDFVLQLGLKFVNAELCLHPLTFKQLTVLSHLVIDLLVCFSELLHLAFEVAFTEFPLFLQVGLLHAHFHAFLFPAALLTLQFLLEFLDLFALSVEFSFCILLFEL